LEIRDRATRVRVANVHISAVTNPYTYRWHIYDDVDGAERDFSGGSPDGPLEKAAQRAIDAIILDLISRVPVAAELNYTGAPRGKYLVAELIELVRDE
jgi:hypothetical protein